MSLLDHLPHLIPVGQTDHGPAAQRQLVQRRMPDDHHYAQPRTVLPRQTNRVGQGRTGLGLRLQGQENALEAPRGPQDREPDVAPPGILGAESGTESPRGTG
jgi:hypothetical protein